MKRIETIIVCLKHSHALGDPLLVHACGLATRYGARLHLVSVIETPRGLMELLMPGFERHRLATLVHDDRKQHLQELQRQLEEKGISASFALPEGRPYVQVIEETKREKAELVVVSARGSNRGDADFFGTTALMLLRKCPAPVWVVKPNTPPRFRRILAAVDPSSSRAEERAIDADILEYASALARDEGAELFVLHAWHVYGEEAVRPSLQENVFEEIERGIREGSRAALDALLQGVDPPLDPARVLLVEGHPAEAITRQVVDSDIDLVVMGTVTPSGLGRTLMGSTAERVLRNVRCSVLAIKPPEFGAYVAVES